jgi:hypothetical protein
MRSHQALSSLGLLVCLSCGHASTQTASQNVQAPAPRSTSAQAVAAVVAWSTPAAPEAKPEPYAWIKDRLPKGGKIEGDQPMHTVRPGEVAVTIARQWVAFTDVYHEEDLAKEIMKANPKTWLAVGSTIKIPHVLPNAPPPPTRLPKTDAPMKGIFILGTSATRTWEKTLEHLSERGMNAVTLDGKAYMGDVTYPTKVKQAVETGAQKYAPLSDFARTIRFAHEHGIYVHVKIACFHDPWAAERAPRLSVRGTWGGPYPIGWLDPANPEVLEYVEGLVVEAMDAGADEIQLDYVRYPAQPGLGNADFKYYMNGRRKQEVIRDFVHEVHELTKARGVPLGVDVFGVTATGTQEDIDHLGQDLSMMGKDVEFVLPMVYPSHYGEGFYGFAVPGDHPEIVGIGTKATIAKLAGTGAKVRPWLQTFNWKSPAYGPQYIRDEIKSGEDAGGSGYMMWNPGSEYSTSWAAVPVKK